MLCLRIEELKTQKDKKGQILNETAFYTVMSYITLTCGFDRNGPKIRVRHMVLEALRFLSVYKRVKNWHSVSCLSDWNNARRLLLPVRSSRGVLKDSLFHCSRNTKQKVQANHNINGYIHPTVTIRGSELQLTDNIY